MSFNDPIIIHHSNASAVSPVVLTEKKEASSGAPDVLILAFMEIYQSVLLGQHSAQAQAEILTSNAAAQDKKINEEAAWNFVIFSAGVDPTTVQSDQSSNQEISAIRGVLEDQISSIRQNGQITMTDLNSTINEVQQSMGEDSSITQMLLSLTNQICRI